MFGVFPNRGFVTPEAQAVNTFGKQLQVVGRTRLYLFPNTRNAFGNAFANVLREGANMRERMEDAFSLEGWLMAVGVAAFFILIQTLELLCGR